MMNTTDVNTCLTVGQLHILEMMTRCETEESLKQLKKVLFDFYVKEAEQEAERLSTCVPLTFMQNEKVIRVSPTFFFNLIQSDPDDNKFVDCAICGNAEIIVSNDAHFNILKQIGWPKLSVIRIEEYTTP